MTTGSNTSENKPVVTHFIASVNERDYAAF
jgi:hypothetical protein